jgi:hypothetical protein
MEIGKSLENLSLSTVTSNTINEQQQSVHVVAAEFDEELWTATIQRHANTLFSKTSVMTYKIALEELLT